MDKDGQGWMAAELLVSVILVLCLGVGVECGQKSQPLDTQVMSLQPPRFPTGGRS